MSRAHRLRAVRAGRWAEALCVWMLRLKGYRVLARDLRTPVGEVDIVARRRRVLAVVEVKARATMDEAATALGAKQRQRIARAAGYLQATLPAARDADIRFDVMLVVPWRLPVHIINAWGH
ncbi:MAG: YraN family protein [Rhodospirillales bacterium]|nr:YraN family protein [Rhodospirillales bacterium]